MIRALDRALERAGAGVAQQRTAVTADVVKGAQRTVVIADDDDVLSSDVGGVVCPRLGHVLGSAGAGPAAPEDGVDLTLVNLVRAVELRGQCLITRGHVTSIAES